MKTSAPFEVSGTIKVAAGPGTSADYGNSSGTAGWGFYSSGSRMSAIADGVVALLLGNNQMVLANGRPLVLSADGSGTGDTSFSRLSAGVVGLGNGTTGDFSGTLKLGMVWATGAGFKFPDGTTQSTAATGGGSGGTSIGVALAVARGAVSL